MKKFLIVFVLIVSMFLCACEKKSSLIDNVIELRENVYYGESADYKVKCSYGYKKDGNNKKVYSLSFKLLDKEQSPSTYSVSFSFKGTDYAKNFFLSPVIDTLIADFEIDGFDLSTFPVSVSCGGESEQVELSSEVPNNVISYNDALCNLQKNQPELLKNYTDNNGKFSANIIMRITVVSSKPYWYIALVQDKSTKAFLMNGISGEIIAIREIFQ